MSVVPYKDQATGKKQQVAHMFNSISARYDFLNHLLSLGIDRLWRKKAVRLLQKSRPRVILDIATGTGDFALEAMKLNPDKIIGLDISDGMLAVGRRKVQRRGWASRIEMVNGDSENLPFEENSFDAVIVAFGVRNFENLERGLTEMRRVLKPGGTVSILEFSKPRAFPMKQLYGFYFRAVLPWLGRVVSKHQTAYSYLPDSVAAFPDGNDFLAILKKIGYQQPTCLPLTFGVASLYRAQK
jgi:demethylmenaquinone methyltransferase/2-methoxy-6-polyprenyl-1,4-benzoquinol methylase